MSCRDGQYGDIPQGEPTTFSDWISGMYESTAGADYMKVLTVIGIVLTLISIMRK